MSIKLTIADQAHRLKTIYPLFRVLIVISLHFMKKFFHHENTKFILSSFVFSSLRAFVINLFFGSGLAGLGDTNNSDPELLPFL